MNAWKVPNSEDVVHVDYFTDGDARGERLALVLKGEPEWADWHAEVEGMVEPRLHRVVRELYLHRELHSPV